MECFPSVWKLIVVPVKQSDVKIWHVNGASLSGDPWLDGIDSKRLYWSSCPSAGQRHPARTSRGIAGVGLGTASRALRNAPGVAPATRDRVLAVAEELAYVVSPQASSLRLGSTGQVAVVVPHLDRWFFGAMLAGLESVLRDAELDVLLYPVGDLQDRRVFFKRLPGPTQGRRRRHRRLPARAVENNDAWNSWASTSSRPADSRPTTPTSASTTRSPAGRPWTTCSTWATAGSACSRRSTPTSPTWSRGGRPRTTRR